MAEEREGLLVLFSRIIEQVRIEWAQFGYDKSCWGTFTIVLYFFKIWSNSIFIVSTE